MFPVDSTTLKTPIHTLRPLLEALGELITNRDGRGEKEVKIKQHQKNLGRIQILSQYIQNVYR
jgi:hypothetical protein